MRSTLLVLLAAGTVACASDDDMAMDTAAGMMDTMTTARLTTADLTGTWNGTTMMMDGDSVLGRWTVTSTSDNAGLAIDAATNDTVRYSIMTDADSMVATSEAHVDEMMPGNPEVTWRAVGHMRDGKLVGTTTVRLASNPDSVLMRTRWEATRAP